MKLIKLDKNEVKNIRIMSTYLKDHSSYTLKDRKSFKSILNKLNQPVIEVYGRRWFQKSYGNTYNSVVIYVDGVEVANMPFNYGYGDHYRTIALEKLSELEILPKYIHKIASYELRENYNINYSVQDVDRKKDL